MPNTSSPLSVTVRLTLSELDDLTAGTSHLTNARWTAYTRAPEKFKNSAFARYEQAVQLDAMLRSMRELATPS